MCCRQQLMQKSTVDFTATNEVTASLQAQLDGKIRELLQLQSEQTLQQTLLYCMALSSSRFGSPMIVSRHKM
jgi:hypothetical protein